MERLGTTFVAQGSTGWGTTAPQVEIEKGVCSQAKGKRLGAIILPVTSDKYFLAIYIPNNCRGFVGHTGTKLWMAKREERRD